MSGTEESKGAYRFWPDAALDEVLAARERRAAGQRELSAEYGLPLISFSMNIAGPVKNSPLISLAFFQGLARLKHELGQPLACHQSQEAPGPWALLVYDRPAPELKALCLSLEEDGPVGRLYDLDVLDARGTKLFRAQPRRCLLCDEPAFVCASRRRHPLPELRRRTERLLTDFAAGVLAADATKALLWEARLTPKPGLVDRRNSGAHQDMDLAMFEASAGALEDYFAEAFRLGADNGTGRGWTRQGDITEKPGPGSPPAAFLAALRRAGLAAEERMYGVTGGVNTHKGAIYSFGLFLAALGERLTGGGEVFSQASRFAQGLERLSLEQGERASEAAAEAFAGVALAGLSHGQRARLRYGAGGARRQAALGFPLARQAFQRLKSQEPVTVLLELIALCDDTNLLHRGGEEGLCFAQREARRILDAPKQERQALAAVLDDEFIRRNLSPGGSADLLALARLLTLTEPLWQSGD